MNYKYLSDLGHHYLFEEGTAGCRVAALIGLEAVLKKAIQDARGLAAPPPQPGHRRLPNRPGYDAAKRKADMYKRWLQMEGAVVDANGNIDWPRSQRTVVYDHQLGRQGMTRVYFSAGKLRILDRAGNMADLDTKDMVTHFTGPGKAIFVMSAQGNLHVSSHSVGHRHHSSLLAGRSVAGAGELEVSQGQLVWLSNKSGHYRPSVAHMLQVLHQLQKKKVPMTFRLTVLSSTGVQEYGTVGDFLRDLELSGEPDYELTKLLAYGHHLTPDVLAGNGWRWREAPSEKPGVYELSSNRFVPHRTVRKWLKSQGLLANVEVQSGVGR